ncbi:hypothetical protein CCR87_08300 [Rhodobaculum claviforme]|uniref:histidine kinase n=2 Tax=Rhodobaculum claviforme TaxID=1549854 RepID=A0A934TKW5_9RHOB|nr:ATP-binding protein [Rhodobaculum claviforme]MBK5927326.1 hypothetical protein [Rhodobaculum claviforme]
MDGAERGDACVPQAPALEAIVRAVLDGTRYEGFDRLARLAGRALGADVGLVSLIDGAGDRQVFAGAAGLPAGLTAARCTPLVYSFCRHVVSTGQALVVDDARRHPLVHANPAIEELGVRAYLGEPVLAPDGTPVAAMCTIARAPRRWSAQDRALVADFAALARDQLALVLGLHARDAALAAERAVAATKARVLATMSHEIRTPLGGVLGMAEVLAEGPLAPDQRELVRIIRASGLDLLGILDNLLDMARLDAGKLTLEVAPFSLRAVLEAVVTPARALAAHKGLALHLVGAGDLPPGDLVPEPLVPETLPAGDLRLGDRLRVQQVLWNLTSNAVKFTAHGRIVVRLTEEAPGMLAFAVCDTGIGMDPVQIARLFEPFEQADTSTARRHGGAGLGMSIVRGLVDLLGGTIAVDSAPGQGTQVTVRVPLPQAPDPAPSGAVSLEGVRVLVADDNATNRRLLTILLQRAGAVVAVVCDGVQAVQAARGGGFDVLVLDIAMPGLDGMAALARIRAAAPDGPAAVALTANAAPEQSAAYRAAGFAAVLPKPIEAQALIGTLARLAGRIDTGR